MGNTLNAVIQVLKDAGEPLHYKEIARRVLDSHLWTSSGKTPEATSTLYDAPSQLFVPAVVTAENIKAEIFDKGIQTPEEICTGEYAEGCKTLGITQ